MIANFSSSELYKYTEMITPGKISQCLGEPKMDKCHKQF